jgi:hypothetical protein
MKKQKENILSDLRELHVFMYRVGLDMEMYPDDNMRERGKELQGAAKMAKSWIEEIKRLK